MPSESGDLYTERTMRWPGLGLPIGENPFQEKRRYNHTVNVGVSSALVLNAVTNVPILSTPFAKGYAHYKLAPEPCYP